MNLAIFGATGGTGRCLLEQALGEGHQITALVRNPAAMRFSHERLRVLQGDALDPVRVEAAVSGQDAVLSALGVRDPFHETHVLSETMRNIISAMQKHGVRRLVVESSFGVGESYALSADWLQRLAARVLLRKIFADKEREDEIIRQSGLDWIVVRPPTLTNGPHTGRYRAGTDLRIGFRNRISRADVADFMLKQLTDNRYVQQFPIISY